MAKFKRGDRVRCIKDCTFHGELKKGMTATVDQDDSPAPWLLIDGMDGDNRWASYEDSLELITDYKKLEPKVGQKYRVLKKHIEEHDIKVGDIFTIKESHGCYLKTNHTNFVLNCAYDYFTTEYLELVEDVECECEGTNECQHESHFVDSKTSCPCDNTRVCRKCIIQEPMITHGDVMKINKPTLKQRTMNMIKKLTQSKDDKVLEQAGFTDSCGELTDKTREILLAQLFIEKKKELVAMANEELEDKA